MAPVEKVGLVLNAETDPVGLMRRYENMLVGIRGEQARLEHGIKTERDNVTRLERTLKETWPKETEYRQALDKREALERALSGAERQGDVRQAQEAQAPAERSPLPAGEYSCRWVQARC